MKETAYHMTHRLVGMGVKQGINILIFFTAARLLSPHDFGIYNYIFALALAVATLGDFGISTAAAKYVAKRNATSNEGNTHIAGSALAVVCVASTALALALFVFHSFLRIDPTYLAPLVVIIYFVPVFSVFDGLYRGVFNNNIQMYASVGGAVAAILGGLFLMPTYGIVGTIATHALFYVAGVCIFLLSYPKPVFRAHKDTIQDIARVSIPIGMIALVYLAYARIDAIMLGLFGYTVEVGYYEMANKIILMLSLPVQIYAQVESPHIVALWHRARETVYGYALKHIQAGIVIFTGAAVLVYIMAPLVIGAFFETYAQDVVFATLTILLIAFLFQATADLIGNTFTIATDHESLNLRIMTIFAIVNICLVYLGIRYFGFMGVAYAKIAVYIPYTLTFLLLYLRRLRGVRP